MRRFLCLALCLTGCLQVVGETSPDSGAGGGGVGGGAGGGAGIGGGANVGGGSASGGGTAFVDGGCDAPADCPGSQTAVQFCGAVGGAGWSCVDHSCLWECNGGRTCEIDTDAGCLHCDNLGTECAQSFCGSMTRNANIQSSTCTALPMGSAVQLTGSAGCDYDFELGGGVGTIGHIQEVSGGDFIANLPLLGGECTGTMLPTNVERWVFNCPGCQIVVEFL
jgi:hypothetical protein